MKLLKKILLFIACCAIIAPHCSAQLNTLPQLAVPANALVIDMRELLPEKDQRNIEFYRTFINGFFTVDVPTKTITSTIGQQYRYSFAKAFRLLRNAINGMEITPNTNRLHNLIALLARKSMPANTHEHYYYGDLLTMLHMVNNPEITVHYLTKLRISSLLNFEYDKALAACIPATQEDLYTNGGIAFQNDFAIAYLEFKNNFDQHAGNKV